MKKLLKRVAAVTGAAVLSLAGVAVTSAPAQALPGSVAFTDQSCDIDTGGTLGLTVDGVDFTVTNSAEVAEPLDFRVVRGLSEVYIQSVTLAPGASQRFVVPLDEDVSTAVQVIDNVATENTVIGGVTRTVNCTPNSSPAAVATIAEASCEFPTGGIIPPSPGFSFTLDNSAGTGPADYDFVLDGESYESGVVAAGDTRVRAVSVPPNSTGTSEIRSVDLAGDPVSLATGTYDLECDPPAEPDFNYSPEAIGAVTDADCLLPTGGTLVPFLAGVEFTLDNAEGSGDADYAFTANGEVVESGTVAAGDTRIRSIELTEDEATLVQVTSVDAEGAEAVLATRSVTLDCEANVPTIITPTQGQVIGTNTVEITGQATAGEEVVITVGDVDELTAYIESQTAAPVDGFAAAAAPIVDPIIDFAGITAYPAPVAADGTFAISVVLDNGDYAAVAVATRAGAAADDLPTVSGPSEVVAFTVNAVPAVVSPAGNGGSLAATGTDPALPLGIGTLLVLLGAAGVVLRRRFATV